jgi:acetyl-CoA/propionyl-CoA carboxylase, biotin carboxylase, biotin carboxyl carrier protein
MFETVLVANRGEIAVRVIRTLRELGVRSVAVYSDADAGAVHVRAADQAVRLGPAPARESYLSIERVIEAARRSGAEAIHPGYGFLSENAEFARGCTVAGLVFIGPPAAAVQIMGDKISAKRTVAAAGVPVVPGRSEPGMTDADLLDAAAEVGYPVLIKPAAVGGGKGMHLVTDPGELATALVSARREALSGFGDDTLFVERYVSRPRHIEVQVLADAHGHAIHLGERECSLQRRHQKIIEEAPSVLLDAATRARIGAAAVETARSVGYLGAGTVEFIVSADRPSEFFFLEMNTRLQVEHPVTELVSGVDLVAEQLRVAAGEPLRLSQDEVRLDGHAIEARLYAEDPARGFLPTGGPVLRLREPAGPGLRVDSGIGEGSRVGTWYDPMLSKVIAWGPDRAAALSRLRQALSRTAVLGVATNLEFLQSLLAHPEVVAGRLDTQLVDRELAVLVPAAGAAIPDRALAAYGLVRLLALQPAGPVIDPWQRPTGWRVGAPRALLFRVVGPDGGEPVEVKVAGDPNDATIWIGDGPSASASIVLDDPDLLITVDGDTNRWLSAIERRADHDRVWLSGEGRTSILSEAVLHTRPAAALTGTQIRSPMPGVVLAVHVAAGDPVHPGQPLIVVEAMKMEHAVTATQDGQLDQVLVRVGDQVTLDQLLATTVPLPVREV